jgi:hypothetical protein
MDTAKKAPEPLDIDFLPVQHAERVVGEDRWRRLVFFNFHVRILSGHRLNR